MAKKDSSDAPEGTKQLSAAQFATVPMPQAHSGKPHEPHPAGSGGPLSLMASTMGSSKEAATWRKPGTALPYSRATQSSVFTPF